MSGVFRPGVLTSLMGASGAGKTTLMGEAVGEEAAEGEWKELQGMLESAHVRLNDC